ncbi:MAG: hypothetical protein J3R72DRAFT_418984 [Linnemannia gamsii]|nr:MAG: hypothetical protein J3R72DRAFT_418984 [Linnemannia gamsii]
MARKKTAARKGRLIATQSGSHHHPYRNKHHISASPSVASSPSPQPQPHDLVQQRRRKGTPVRSPSQGDTSKGIVFSFRIQPGSDLSIDIRRYDQVSDEPAESQARTSTTNSSSTSSQAEASPSIASTGATTAASASPISGSSNKSSDGREASASLVSTQLNLAGEKWSSDPSSYLSNNVVDLTRNVLILHSRKPQDTLASSSSSTTAPSYLYSRSVVPSRSSSMSLPSTPPLTTDSSSSYSSASSSPSSSPSSPSSPMLEATTVAGGSSSEKELSSSFSDHLLPDPMVADLKSQVPRMLRVRGLGSASRRMQVYVV